jgi:DNA gyrase subunit B
VLEALKAQKIECELKREEEHSAWMVTFRDPTNAERAIDTELATQPEYRRLRTLAKQAARLNKAPFTVIRDNQRETQPDWRGLLAHVKNEGTREVSIQRYKGLGEMNAEQLWQTTMNPETRTLYKVQIQDALAAEQIFTTLMGDQVEPRRQFIEAHALEASNLDI